MSDDNVIAFNPFISKAHELLHQRGLTPRIWKHVGSEGVNIFSEELMKELVELGCKAQAYRPEAIGNPDRLAWEVILPRPIEPSDDEEGVPNGEEAN